MPDGSKLPDSKKGMVIIVKNYIHEEIRIRNDIQVRFDIYRDTNHLITSHWHNSMEIVYICRGNMDVTIKNTVYPLAETDFIIINSTDVHSTYCHGDSLILLLQIPYQFLKKSIPEYDFIRFDGNYSSNKADDRKKSDVIRYILLEMKNVYEKKPEGFSLRFTSLLYDFLYTLMQSYKSEVDTASKIRTDKNLLRLEAVMNYVKNNFSTAVSLENAASVISLNPEYFCRFFKKYVGITFLEYVNRVRLTHVYDDLIHTDLSITDILERSGCTNYKLFIRNFKATYGCTPSQMREKLRNAQN